MPPNAQVAVEHKREEEDAGEGDEKDSDFLHVCFRTGIGIGFCAVAHYNASYLLHFRIKISAKNPTVFPYKSARKTDESCEFIE